MKTVVILALAFVVLQIEAKPLLRFKRAAGEVDAERCVRELSLDKDKILEISNRDYAPENDQEYIKFMKCYWKRKGYLNQDGSINYDALHNMITKIFEEDFNSSFSKNVADTVLNKCKNLHATSAGQRAIKAENCILTNLKELME